MEKRTEITSRRGPVALALLLGAGLCFAAPAAAAPSGGDFAVSVDVPFSSAELAEALHVRGVTWSRQIRVRLGPSGWTLIESEGQRLEVDLEGREGAAAARVVALALIAKFGTAPTPAATAPPADVVAMTPPSSASPSPSSVRKTPEPGANPPKSERAKLHRWITFGPSLAVNFTLDTGGQATGIAAGADLKTWEWVRITSGLTFFGVHLVTTDGLARFEDRAITGRIGVAIGTGTIGVHLGPQLEYHRYEGNCIDASEALVGGYASVRGIYRLGDRVGLVGAASYSRSATNSINECFSEFGTRYELGRTDTAFMAGIAYGL